MLLLVDWRTAWLISKVERKKKLEKKKKRGKELKNKTKK